MNALWFWEEGVWDRYYFCTTALLRKTLHDQLVRPNPLWDALTAEGEKKGWKVGSILRIRMPEHYDVKG